MSDNEKSRFAKVLRDNYEVERISFDDLKAGDIFVLYEPDGTIVHTMSEETSADPRSCEYSMFWREALSDAADGMIKLQPLPLERARELTKLDEMLKLFIDSSK